MKRIAVMMAVLAVAAGCATNAQVSETNFVGDAMKPYVENGVLPGAISVLYDNGAEEICCIGYADLEAKRPIAMDNVYMQCSQTKGFCGVTVAKLIEEGKLGLDDPVSKYLPEFQTLWVLESEDGETKVLRRAKNALTVRMCLNHMGGFPFECSAKRNDVRGGGWSGGAPIRQVASIAAASPLLFEPGTSVTYSNTGIDIAAAVVEVVSGMKWEDYLKQTVLDPLGMKSSSFRPTDAQLENKIEMYSTDSEGKAVWVEENPWQQRPYNDAHVFASAGAGLWTTASDQLKFYKMLMNLGLGENGVRILEEETVKTLLAVSSRPAEISDGYSLGLGAPVVDHEDGWFGHGGAWGTNCFVNWHKKQLKLWVIQHSAGEQPWQEDLWKAQEAFFRHQLDNNSEKAYTGRTE